MFIARGRSDRGGRWPDAPPTRLFSTASPPLRALPVSSSDPSIGIDRPTTTINGIPWNSRRFETPLPSSSAPPTIRVYAREFGAILGQLPVNYARSSRIGWVGQVFLGGAGTGNGSRWRDSIYSIRFLVREAWVVFGELFEIVKFWGNARERILWENGAFDII